MSFLGFPFPENVQSFATHGQVLDYLCSYADQHELHPLIKLGCPVESIRPIPIDSSPTPLANSVNAAADGSDEMPPAAKARGEQDKPEAFDGWEVVYRRDRDNGSTREHVGIASNGGGDGATSVVEIFDAVCVCNGHFDKPFVPQVEGFEGFQGTSMHAYAYDTPDVETFVGRRVLCVGSRSSGADIAREVSSVGKHAFVGYSKGHPIRNSSTRPGWVSYLGEGAFSYTFFCFFRSCHLLSSQFFIFFLPP